jgi:hypothetical protein
MKRILTIAIATLTMSAAVSAIAQEMPAGKWEVKTKIEMPGMPAEMAAKMGAKVFTHCIVAGKNKWSDEHSPSAQRSCERTDMKVSGNDISWKMKCKEGITGDGTVKHNGKDAYTMTVNMASPRGVMKMQSEGKRLSATCDVK